MFAENYLRDHNNGVDALFADESPKIGNRVLQRILRYNERLRVIVAFDERRIYIGRVFATRYWRQNHAVPIERYHKFGAVFVAVLFQITSGACFVGVVSDGFDFLRQRKCVNILLTAQGFIYDMNMFTSNCSSNLHCSLLSFDLILSASTVLLRSVAAIAVLPN